MESQENSKKCFCARCFLAVEPTDKVNIEGQNFHRLCCMCCTCHTTPTSPKLFYGHVFCAKCFNAHVLMKFRDEDPRVYSNSWWMQFAPGAKPQETQNYGDKDEETMSPMDAEDHTPRCFCARCLHVLNENTKVDIGGQSFHPFCAKCYFCRSIPTDRVKICYGQVFCEDCFHSHVLTRNRDNPSEFFRACFEQWQNNEQFAENMKDFMSGSQNAPFIVIQGAQPFWGSGCGSPEWFQPNEIRKSVTPAVLSIGDESFATWDLSFLEKSYVDESVNQTVTAEEKIAKLTKYLHNRLCDKSEKSAKNWKKIFEYEKPRIFNSKQSHCGYVYLSDKKIKKLSRLNCPKCLWQCGSIYVGNKM